MSQGLLEVLAEFFDAIGSQKAHWYRVFDPGNGDEAYPLIQSTFPSLASLMKMESVFIRELFLVVGLVRKKLHHGAYILYADRGAWDSFIHNFCLGMETTFFRSRIKKAFTSKSANGRIPGIFQGHRVTFGKKHQKEGSMTYQSFESILQLSNWLGILGSSLPIPLFFCHQYKKKKK